VEEIHGFLYGTSTDYLNNKLEKWKGEYHKS